MTYPRPIWIPRTLLAAVSIAPLFTGGGQIDNGDTIGCTADDNSGEAFSTIPKLLK